jgi:hypothetical protein
MMQKIIRICEDSLRQNLTFTFSIDVPLGTPVASETTWLTRSWVRAVTRHVKRQNFIVDARADVNRYTLMTTGFMRSGALVNTYSRLVREATGKLVMYEGDWSQTLSGAGMSQSDANFPQAHFL